MTLDEFRGLKPEDFPRWPWQAQVGVSAVLLGALAALFYFLALRPLNAQYAQLQGTEATLKTQVRDKQKLAANLDVYQHQLKEIEGRFEYMLRQLPSQAEIPSLLDDITLAGRSRGLDFDLFQPLPEQRLDFDAEVPVKIKVVGDYNALGNFAAAVAAMPRIVTLQDLDISRVDSPTAPAQSGVATAKLRMEGTAKTYRYLGEEEMNAQAKAKREAKS